MKKILVPTDFSKYALNAAKLAADIARKFDARIYFLHVVDIPDLGNTGMLPGESRDNTTFGILLLKRVKQQFEELLSQDFMKGINAVTAIQYEGVYDSVIKQAEEHEIDLIVMGTHGSSGYVNDFFIGSNTDKIVRLSKIPVITIREEVKSADFKNIVFASDFESKSTASFRTIADLANQFDAKVDLLRVITQDDFQYTGPMLKHMDEFASENGLSNYSSHVYAASSVQDGINEFAQSVRADLVTTITNGRRGLARLFNGSVTSDIMKSSPIPVMTIKI